MKESVRMFCWEPSSVSCDLEEGLELLVGASPHAK